MSIPLCGGRGQRVSLTQVRHNQHSPLTGELVTVMPGTTLVAFASW